MKLHNVSFYYEFFKYNVAQYCYITAFTALKYTHIQIQRHSIKNTNNTQTHTHTHSSFSKSRVLYVSAFPCLFWLVQCVCLIPNDTQPESGRHGTHKL